MSKVFASTTTSVDGYVTGPDDGPEEGLGEGGERLHYLDHSPGRCAAVNKGHALNATAAA